MLFLCRTISSKRLILNLIRNEPHALVLLLLIKHVLVDIAFFETNLAGYHDFRWAYLHMCGDIEINPGPDPKTEHLRVMHWNLNNLKAHNFERLNNLKAYNAMHGCHILAISESGISSKIESNKIEIPGYSLIRYDLVGDDSHGGVIIYHKQDLSAKQRIDLDAPTYTLVLELSICRKKVFFVLSYRKFGQSNEDFLTYSKKFDNLMEKISLETPFCSLITGDYNSHNKIWYQGDKSDKYGLAIQ